MVLLCLMLSGLGNVPNTQVMRQLYYSILIAHRCRQLYISVLIIYHCTETVEVNISFCCCCFDKAIHVLTLTNIT